MPAWTPLVARGFLRQDLISVAGGLRPACRLILPAPDAWTRALLARFLRETRLKAREYSENPGAPLLLLGRDAARLRSLERADLERQRLSRLPDDGRLGKAIERIGRLLGYPECCVAAFDETQNERMPLAVLARSGPGPYPFANNFLYNFQSRGGTAAERLWKKGYALNAMFLLPWIPCRFDCKPSARFGARLFKALEPEFAAELRRHLATSMFYLDDENFGPQKARLPSALARGDWKTIKFR